MSNYSKSESWLKEYANDSMKQFQMGLDKESEINIPSYSKTSQAFKKTQNSFLETNWLWDLEKVRKE